MYVLTCVRLSVNCDKASRGGNRRASDSSFVYISCIRKKQQYIVTIQTQNLLALTNNIPA